MAEKKTARKPTTNPKKPGRTAAPGPAGLRHRLQAAEEKIALLQHQGALLQQTQRALAESEERYRFLVELSPEAILVHSEGKYVYANPAAAVLARAPGPDAIVGRDVLDLVPPDFHDFVRARVERSYAERVEVPHQAAKMLRFDGTSVDLEVATAPIVYNGKPATQVVIRDVSVRKEAERDMQEARDRVVSARIRFETVLESIPSGVLVFDAATGRTLIQNRPVKALLGEGLEHASPDQLVAKMRFTRPDGALFRPGELPAVVAMRTGEPVRDVEVVITAPDGRKVTNLANAAPLRDEAGAITGAVVVFSDITERKRAEDEMRTILQTAMDGFWITDLRGRFLDVNEAYCGLIGYGREELLQMAIPDVEDRESPADTAAHIRKVIEQGSDRFETRHRRKDGRVVDIEVSVNYLADGEGRMFVFLRDISERKRSEEALLAAHGELKRRTTELEAVNRELEDFTYTVSHDLRAPLRSIEGFTRAILEDAVPLLDAVGKDHFERIEAASRRMAQLIEALQHLARTTRRELLEKIVDLSALAEVTVQDLRKKDPGRSVAFRCTANVKGKGDATMLQVVLENLLDNAWKFTARRDHAEIEFGETERDGAQVFFVRDDGAGFDPEYADKLFSPFKRLHGDREFPGLGIGLAIVRQIILRHGGRIWAESAPGKGATFFFTLA